MAFAHIALFFAESEIPEPMVCARFERGGSRGGVKNLLEKFLRSCGRFPFGDEKSGVGNEILEIVLRRFFLVIGRQSFERRCAVAGVNELVDFLNEWRASFGGRERSGFRRFLLRLLRTIKQNSQNQSDGESAHKKR